MALSVSITSTTLQSAPSHSAAHNALHTIANQYFTDKQAGTGVRVDILTSGASPLGGVVQPAALKIWHGSTTTPITDDNLPTVLISRVDRNVDNGPQNAALYISVQGDGTATTPGIINQPGCIVTSAVRDGGKGDVCAYSAIVWHGTNSGDHLTDVGIAYGLYLQPEGWNATLSGAVAIQIAVGNNSGSHKAYDPTTFNRWAALDLTSGASKYIGCYIQLRGYADVGIGALNGSTIVNAFLSDDSTGITSYRIRGTHTTGIDTTNASISGTAVIAKSAGAFQVTVLNPAGDATVLLQSAASASQSLTLWEAGTERIRMGHFSGTGWSIYDVQGSRHMLSIDPSWVAAANQTPIYMRVNASMRQVRTFNDGTHDVLYVV